MKLYKKLLLISSVASVLNTVTPVYAYSEISTISKLTDIGLTQLDSKATPLIVSTLGNDPDWSNEEAYMTNNAYYLKGLAGQCTWFAAGRFYEIYGFDPGFRGNGKNCVDQLIEAHGDLFEKSDTPVAGAVFSLRGGEYGHVGIVTAVYDDGSFDIQDCNVSSILHPETLQNLPAAYKGTSGVTGYWRSIHVDSVDDAEWLTGEWNLPKVKAVFANPKNAMTQSEYESWKFSQTTDVSVSVVWDGVDVPEYYDVNLYADGEKMASIRLTESLQWKYTFSGLPMYYLNSDEQIRYSVTYAAPAGMGVARGGNATDGYTLEIKKKV